MSVQLDKAGQAYWQQLWQGRAIPRPHDPRRRDLNAHMFQRLHRYLQDQLPEAAVSAGAQGAALRLLEAGCGASCWLPYFYSSYGFAIAGVDYSAEGCEQARAIAAQAGVDVDIREADLFAPPEDFKQAFNVVFSIGLVEHFEDTAGVIAQLAVLLKPGGRLITLVPNMHGLTGWLQRSLDREVYDVHVPMCPRQLAAAHRSCGLEIHSACYLGTLNLGVVNLAGRRDCWWYTPVLRLGAWLSKGIWILERAGMPEYRNRLTSPFVACTAVAPGNADAS